MRIRRPWLPTLLVLTLGAPVSDSPASGLDAGALHAQEAPTSVSGRWPVRYVVRFPDAARHEARITAVFPGVPRAPLRVVMSRSSPGRYALHEFAKNVYEVAAVDGQGRPLEVRRMEPWAWEVEGHDGTVRFRYTLYADRADGTYSGIDATHAHLNMPATFAWAPALVDRPHEVTFEPPEGARWRAATQLRPGEGGPGTLVLRAPDHAYFMDSPTELSDHAVREWEAGEGERSQTIRLAVHHAGDDDAVDAYAGLVAAVVDEMAAVFGTLPAFDYGTYTFIADYRDNVSGDGMEHRNSTILTSTGAIGTHEERMRRLGTVSHEFFHAWNMERIRAADLEPFDFLGPNMTGTLWFGEGFTSYYDDLVIHRAGLTDARDYVEGLGGGLSYVINSPARSFRGPAAMSRQALYVDAATWVDPVNFANTFVSYYTYGAALGLGLDLLLRSRYDTDLDAYMRAMWRRHGETGVPYTLGDLEAVLGEVSGDPGFAEAFLRDHVERGALPDYEALLAEAGILLRRAAPDEASLGQASLRWSGEGALVASPTVRGTALAEAGVAAGDVLLRLDGRSLDGQEALEEILAARAPGDAVELVIRTPAGRRAVPVELRADPRLETVLYEDAGLEVTAEMRVLREAWLSSKRGR